MRILYSNTTKLFGIQKVAKGKGTPENGLKKKEKCKWLILDDASLVPLDAKERSILQDIIKDRHGRRTIILSFQLPVAKWNDVIGGRLSQMPYRKESYSGLSAHYRVSLIS